MKGQNGVVTQDYGVIIRAGRIEGLEAINDAVHAARKELQEGVRKQPGTRSRYRWRGKRGPELKARLHIDFGLKGFDGQLRDYHAVVHIFEAQDEVISPVILLRMVEALGIAARGRRTHGELPMLVSIVEVMDKPKGMHQRLIVMKGLQEANYCCSPGTNSRNLFGTVGLKDLLALENGELRLGVSIVRAAEVSGQPPNQMIEGGSEIVSTIPNQGCETSSRWVLQDSDAIDVLSRLRVELIGNGVGITIEEEPRFMVFERFKVFPCSNYFKTWAIQRMHEVHSHHELMLRNCAQV